MKTTTLTSAQRAELRAQAHGLKPVVMIGGEGLTEAVLKEIDMALSAHQLIKVRIFSDDREERTTLQSTICSQLKASAVQHIGKLLVLHRAAHVAAVYPRTEPDSPTRNKKSAAPKTVVLVKPSRSGTRRPTVKKVVLTATQRVTAGGTVKKAKPRQSSVKKRQLG